MAIAAGSAAAVYAERGTNEPQVTERNPRPLAAAVAVYDQVLYIAALFGLALRAGFSPDPV